MKTLIFLITIIAATSLVRAGEIVPLWQMEWDIDSTVAYQSTLGQKFLKGHDEFLMIGTDIGICSMQIRETTTGKIVRTEITNNVYEENDFEILPDSTKFILSIGGIKDFPSGFEVLSLEDFSLINRFDIPLEGDSITEFGNSYVNRIIDVNVDPLKPYVYFILEKALPLQSVDEEKEYYAIKAYNYETGEEVRELRSYKDDNMMMIDVSDDGKYLASINEREAYINIWDLETLSQIKSYQLFRNNPDLAWKTDVSDLRFSKLNSDIIYFSGRFSKIGKPDEFENGVFEYSIERGHHIKRLGENTTSGRLIFAEDEKILFLNNGFTLKFFNFVNDELELKTSQLNNHRVIPNAIYTPKHKCLISSDIGHINSTQYLTITNIDEVEETEIVLYPNPTTNNIQIETSCELNEVQLELLDVNGSLLRNELITVTSGYVSFDLTTFPAGSYFILLKCNEQISTYNVIKEG